jgi:hypothetical protein
MTRACKKPEKRGMHAMFLLLLARRLGFLQVGSCQQQSCQALSIDELATQRHVVSLVDRESLQGDELILVLGQWVAH